MKLTVEKGKDSFRILWYTGGIQRHNGKRCEKVTRAKRVLRVIGIILAVVAVLFVILLDVYKRQVTSVGLLCLITVTSFVQSKFGLFRFAFSPKRAVK